MRATTPSAPTSATASSSAPSDAWEPRKSKWDWRRFLTQDERAVLAAADAAKREWQKLNRERAGITNRAIQRAKYAARAS
jgi:hypothetical protein